MLPKNILIVCGFILIMGFSAGCSGGSHNPVSADLTRSQSIKIEAANSMIPWGTWEIIFDPATKTADYVPLRSLEYTANVTQFMQPPIAKKHLLGIKIDSSSDWGTGHLIVDVSFTHPFPGLTTYTGFDVRGVCIGNGTVSGIVDPNILYAGDEDLHVINADGLTRWFNPTEFTTYGKMFGFTLGKLGTPSYDFTATLNGYKYFCDELGTEDDYTEFFDNPSCPNPRGFFSAGNTNTRRYDLQFATVGGAPQYKFQYAVVASWVPADVEPPTNIPDDFSLAANCQEAYAVTTADQSTLFYKDAGTFGGELVLELAVYDHQGIQKSTGVAEEISAIRLETPDGLIVDGSATFEGAGLLASLLSTDAKKAIYRLTVPETDVNPTQSGDVPVLVGIESADPATYDLEVPGFAYPDGALTAYFNSSVNVSDTNPNLPPVALADTVDGSYTGYIGISIEFDGSDSYDPDGTIVSWEWDSDEDGLYDDGSGTNVEFTFNDAGVFHIDLKVTDNDGATDTLDVPIEITITDKVIYVDDDNTTAPWDGTLANPFQQVQDAVDEVKLKADPVGWTIYVFEGTYTDTLTLSDPGNPNSPGGMVYVTGIQDLTIIGEDGARLIPPMNLNYQKATIRVRSGCSGITIDNFEFKNIYAYQSAVWCEAVNGLTVKNSEIVDPNDSYGYLEFLRAESCSDVLAENNYMDTFNSASTYMDIFVINGGSNVKITGNTVRNFNYWTGYNMYQTAEGYIAMYSVNGGEVSKNKLGEEHHRSVPSSNYVQCPCIDIVGGSGIVVRNNLIYDTYFYDSAGADSLNWAVRVSSSAQNIQIYNNTFERVGPPSSNGGTGSSFGIQITDGIVHTIHSNIIANIQAPSSASAYGIGSAASQACDYGCVWNITGGTTGLYGGSAYAGTGSISQDPMFEDPANFDYHLQTGSPCIGMGKDGVDMGCYGGSDPLED